MCVNTKDKFYVHYKLWNSRCDKWINETRVARKTKDPELENSSKSGPPDVSILINYSIENR